MRPRPPSVIAPNPRPPILRNVLIDLALLSLASLAFSLSFPSFASERGWFPLAYVALAPLFLVAHRARWAATPFYGLFFGYLLDRWLGTAPWLLLTFTVLGIVSGLLSLFRALKKEMKDEPKS